MSSLTSIASTRTAPRGRSWSHLAIAALLVSSGCGDDIKPGGTAPSLTSTTPSDMETGVPLDTTVSARFNVEMAPLGAGSFTLKQGGSAVAGTVDTSANGKTTTFTPSSPLAPNSLFTATIGTTATSAAGEALAADHTWTFTTKAAPFVAVPEVTGTDPDDAATGVAINTTIAATFSEVMDPASVTPTSFTVSAGSTPVAGTVVCSQGNTVATFTPTAPLAPNTSFTARLTTEWKDTAGTAMAAPYMFSFMTGATAALGPAPVNLGTSGNFVVLAKTAISTVPTSHITGNIGVSPAAATFITGFSLVADSTNVFSTSSQITGKAYAANYAVPTPINLTTAVANMQTAYTDAAGRPTPDFTNLLTGNIGGLTLVPGLYKWTSTVTIPNDVTFAGGPNDVWILQVTGDVTMSAMKHVLLAGGARPKNIFWQVAGLASFGAGSHFEGILLVKTSATVQTGATMNGRILAQSNVALQSATVTKP